MVRYAVSPWDPLGNGFSGLVVYSRQRLGPSLNSKEQHHVILCFNRLRSNGRKLIGGLFGNKAAKRQGAMDRYAIDQMMRPFNLKEPFLRDLYSGSQGALNDALATGAFTGPTYAGLDPMQRDGIAGLGSLADPQWASALTS